MCTLSTVAKVQGILQVYKNGTCPLHLHVQHEDVEVTIASGAQWCVEPEEQLLVELRHVLGAEQVNLEFN